MGDVCLSVAKEVIHNGNITAGHTVRKVNVFRTEYINRPVTV